MMDKEDGPSLLIPMSSGNHIKLLEQVSVFVLEHTDRALTDRACWPEEKKKPSLGKFRQPILKHVSKYQCDKCSKNSMFQSEQLRNGQESCNAISSMLTVPYLSNFIYWPQSTDIPLPSKYPTKVKHKRLTSKAPQLCNSRPRVF